MTHTEALEKAEEALNNPHTMYSSGYLLQLMMVLVSEARSAQEPCESA
jgi:hypothetical protein